MHLLFVLFDFTIVFCFAWDDYVASFCNSPFFMLTKNPLPEIFPEGGLLVFMDVPSTSVEQILQLLKEALALFVVLLFQRSFELL